MFPLPLILVAVLGIKLTARMISIRSTAEEIEGGLSAHNFH
jgi:hypothetical protein